MKLSVFGFLVIFLAFPAAICAQQPDTTGATNLFNKAMSQIHARHVDWVKSSASTVNEKNMNEWEVKKIASEYAVLGPMNRGDIEALTFFVLMQASKNAHEDLEESMNKINSINKQKGEIREALTKLNQKKIVLSRAGLDSFKLLLNTPSPNEVVRIIKPHTVRTGKIVINNTTVSTSEIASVKTWMKQKLESMSEIGEMESLRLQMTMDRLSKMMSTLSNLLRKIRDTHNTIIQNLK